MTRRRSILVCLFLLLGTVTAGASAGATASFDAGPDSQPALAQTDAANATNNTTVRHRNPQTYNREGNAGTVRQRLAERLSDRLQGSTVNLSQGQYEDANATLGPEYADLLSQYASVAGETGDETRSETAFSEAAETQRNYTGAVAQYWETYDAYQRAEAAGNTTRMRQLARELDRLAARVNDSAATLDETYRTINETTATATETSADTIANTTTNVTTTQRTLSESLFVETRLSVAAPAERVSFTDPLALRGRLVAANGTPVANRTVTLTVGARALRTTTNASGAFETQYRPVLLPTGEQTVGVTYEPDAASVYRASTANVTLRVESVAATLSLSDAPEGLRFGERFTASGTVRAAERPVPGMPISVTLGGVTVDTVRTDTNGTVLVSGTLPAAVAAGGTSLTAEPAVSGRAVTAAATNTSVQVRASDPTLSLSATGTDGTVNASGTLSANGVPLADRPVELSVNGSSPRTVRTDENGSYAASFDVDGPARLRATFDSEGNLRNAAATARVRAPTTGTEPALPAGWPWVVGALALLAAGVGLYAVRNAGSRPDPDAASESAAGSSGEGSEGSEPAPDPVAIAADRAVAHRENGEFDAAVRAAYAAARAEFGSDDGTATHWEFYRTAALSGHADEALRELTTAYERAAFAPTGADESTADTALDALADLR